MVTDPSRSLFRRGARRLYWSVRRLRHPGGQGLSARSAYKKTWQALTRSLDDAKMVVAGSMDEEQLTLTGTYTVNLLGQLVGIHPTDVVLEIGCGVGRVGKLIAPRCAQWIGTDISPNMIQHAARRLEGLSNVRLVELSTVGLKEIPDATVDVVYCTVVFMHLFEWDRFRYVQEAHRVLRQGGRCFFDNVDIISTHGWKVFTDGLDLPIDRRPAHLGMVSSGDELETYARRAGFSDVRIHRWEDAWVGVTGVKPHAATDPITLV